MAFALRVFFLLCGISGLLTGVWSWPCKQNKNYCCPTGWTLLNDHCYIFQRDARTFADAEKVCNLLDGNLVSITSDLDNALVYELAVLGEASAAWIGLSDAIENNVFLWTDGTDYDFDNFATGQPGTDECVTIQGTGTSGSWVGAACTSEHPYICIKASCCCKY